MRLSIPPRQRSDTDAPAPPTQAVATPELITVRPLGPEAGGWIRRMWPVWWAHRRPIALAILASVVALCAQQAAPLMQRYAIDRDILHRGNIVPVLVLMAATFAVRFGAGWVRRFTGGRISWDIDYELRNIVFDHVQGLDFAHHDELPTGQLVSRTNSDLTLIRQLLSQVPTMFTNVLQFFLALGIMVFLSPLLTLVVAPIIPFLFLLALRMRMVVYPSQWEAQARMADMVGIVDDSVTGVRVVKAFGQEPRELQRVLGALDRLFGARMRNLRLRAKRSSTLQAIPQIGQAAVLALGGWLTLEGRITLGTLVAFMSYLTQLASPARQMANIVVTAQQARAGAERVLELLDSLSDVTEPERPRRLGDPKGRITFENVSFGYLRSQPVLDHFNLTVEPGERIALVGASGSGKSTVELLLPRFYDVQEGAVRIDGVDVRELSFDSLRGEIGMVFEDAFLFSDTVRANIAFGRPDASDVAVEAAARAAEAHGFISELPDGYDTVVGERGLLLSGGQRQRITLARAFITDPSILLLDDATSSIDSRVEAEIHETLRHLMVGRTTILVAHRRSTLRLADRIVVLDRGRVLDSGTHEELLERCELYRDLLTGPDESIETPSAAPPAAPARSEDAWVPPEDDRLVASFNGALNVGSSFRPGGGARSAALSSPPTPRLLAQIEALPPIRDTIDIDVSGEINATPGRFRFRDALRPYLPELALGALIIAGDAAAGLAGPFLVGEATDRGIAVRAVMVLWLIASGYFAVQLFDWWAMWAESYWIGRTTERLLYSLRTRIFAHMQRLGMDYYDREMSGRILTRITSDVDTVAQLMQSGFVNALVNLMGFVGAAVILVVLKPSLALYVMTVVPPLAFGTWLYRFTSTKAYDRQRDRIAAVNADLEENVAGVRVTQAFRREAANVAKFITLTRGYRDAGVRSQWLQAIYFPFAELMGNVAILIVLGIGGGLVRSGRLLEGVLVAFLLYLTQLFAPIQQLSSVFDTYQQASAGLRRISALLRLQPSTPPPLAPVTISRLRGEIEFQRVRFRYPGTATEALSGLNLHIRPGETVALVGETGAGKSTVVKLIARFYDPTAGVVRIDGVPLPDLSPDSYRRQLGYVPQEPFLFAGTVRDNIAYGRFDATDAEVEAVARAVGAHDLIVASGGYLKRVTERGRSLSIGQRQLLCLARALLVDPPILLLDEATSNLDLASEAKVNRAMGIVAHGRTTVIIAHRLQTAQRADRIVVIDRGQMVEDGSHDELVALGGHYAALWQAFSVEPVA